MSAASRLAEVFPRDLTLPVEIILPDGSIVETRGVAYERERDNEELAGHNRLSNVFYQLQIPVADVPQGIKDGSGLAATLVKFSGMTFKVFRREVSLDPLRREVDGMMLILRSAVDV